VPGALPSVEEITLEEELGRLVAEGLRRIPSWSRVWRGCGGFEVTLELKPIYLAVLDAMRAGSAEWQVVTALRRPRTAREICRALEPGDFQICQILWTLRALGAVGPASAAAVRAAARVVVDDVGEAGPAVTEPADEEAIEVVTEPADEEAVEIVTEPADEEAVELVTEPADEVSLELDDEPRAALQADEAFDDGEPSETERPFEIAEPTPAESFHADEHVAGAAVPPVALDAAAADPSPDETQVIPPEALQAALAEASPEKQGDAEPARDATQAIPAQILRAANKGRDLPADRVDEDSPEVAFEEAAEDASEEITAEHAVPDAGDTWELPDEADQAIGWFNAVQRVIYRAVKVDVGAGAANFIRSCCQQLACECHDAVGASALHNDGSWEAAGLREAIREQEIEDPWALYQRLIEIEIEQVRQFMGETRASTLQQQVERVAASVA